MSSPLSSWNISRLLLAALLFATTWCGRVSYTLSDSQLSLLTSQALIENGSINLYSYKMAMPPEQFSNGTWKFTTRGRRETCYYSYPLGNSFLCVPVVAIANFFGLDMANSEQESFLQLLLAAISAVVIFLLLTRIARQFLDEIPSLFVAVAFSFGTTLLSAVSTALWSFDFELIFILLLLDYVLQYETGATQEQRPYFVGMLLFLAWLCRPSALIIVALVSAWMFFRQRKQLLRFVLAMAVPFALFVWFSCSTYGLMLPVYYNPFFWQHAPPTGAGYSERVLALLFSPARGLFLFTPLLLLSFAGFFSATLRRNRIYLVMAGWFVLQLMMIASQPNWWGGWCFGPRLMTDALPPLIIAGVLVLREQLEKNHARAWLVALPLAAFGIFEHAVEGLYNHETVDWNDFPNIDKTPGYYIWNWKQSQLFANETNNRVKQREAEITQELESILPSLRPGVNLLYGFPDNITRTVYDRWEKSGAMPLHLHNNLYSLEQNVRDTFWITQKNFEMIRGMDCYRIVPPEGQPSLGKFLRENEKYNVLLSVSDDGSSALSDSTRAYLERTGAHPDSLRFREGYAALLLHGKLYAEQFEHADTASVSFGNRVFSVHATSNGKATGNRAQLFLNGKDYSPDQRGFNVLVFDDRGNVIETACFDTHVFDARVPKVFAVVRTNNYHD